jgi:hypothetical protein
MGMLPLSIAGVAAAADETSEQFTCITVGYMSYRAAGQLGKFLLLIYPSSVLNSTGQI